MAVTDKTTKTMDIAMPGSTMPDESSRPVLITHRSRVQDPTLVSSTETVDKQEADSAEAPEKTEPSPSTHGDRVIQPLQEKPNKSQPTDTKTEATQTIAETKDAVEEAVIDAVVSQANTGHSKIDEKQNQQDEVRQENIQKLIASKQYFLPVGQTAERRNRRAIVALVFILLAGAGGAYAALDSQLISNKLSLPYQFKKEKPSEIVAPILVPVVAPKPVATTKKYTSKLDSLTFDYPLSWTIVQSSLTNNPEYLLIQPTALADSSKTIQVQFNRLNQASGITSVLNRKISKIEYNELPGGTTKKLYIRQLVYEETTKDAKWFGVALNVTDKKGTEKPGEVITDFDTPFLAADGKTKLVLNCLISIKEPGSGGAKTLGGAETYMATNKDFLDAKKTLLSLKLK